MCALRLSVLLGTAFLCACLTTSSGSEFFSAIAGLESLLETEITLAKDLRIYIDYAKQHIKLLEDELLAIESEHALALKDTDNYLTNPVNAYRLMKRLHSDWETYEERISHKTIETYFLSRMSYYRENLNFPSKEDVDGSALGLVRLQDTYKLDVRQVAAGILNGVKYGNDMSWKDCFTLGQLLWDKHELNYTKLWFRESIERLTKETYATDPYSLDVIEGVVQNLYQLGDVESAFNYTQRLLQLDPKREHIWSELEKLQIYNTEKPQEIPPTKPLPYQQSQEFKTYEKVCRGELTQTAAQQRHLRCRYTTNNIPYHYLAPFKIEEHNLMPLVVTYHDMISTHRIDTIKSIAMPLMRRSTVNSKTSMTGDVSQVRVSKNAWLPYETHPYTKDMLRDVHDATGLDVTFAEQLQVANYGLGGHYEPHFDFFLDTERVSPTEGNRIATAIFYFSDVEQGGATAFPHLKFAVKPQKGNVLFWYNLHESGDRDYRTKHAGCPVLMGSKWIANVWIHEMTQTFARPCGRERGHEVSLQYKEVV